MSDNNGWPDPARPGVPPNKGPHWLRYGSSDDIYWWNGKEYWSEIEGGYHSESWRPTVEWASACTYLGPCLTPAEVEARVADARRDALAEAARRVEIMWLMFREKDNGASDWIFRAHDDIPTGDDFVAAIRALGEKE